MGIYAKVLFVLGMVDRLAELADIRHVNFDDQSASVELAFSVAEYFELNPDEAREVVAEVAGVVSGWREEADREVYEAYPAITLLQFVLLQRG